jgi:hypothetical protein
MEYSSVNDPKLYQRGVNQNLRGMDTSFSNMHISMEDNNRSLHNAQTYQGMNVIPNQVAFPVQPQPKRNVEPTFIPRQHKLVISSNNRLGSGDTHGNFKVILQQPIKDVVSARLLSCIVYDVDSDYASGSASFTKPTDFLTLHIDQFDKNLGTTSGNAGFGDRLEGSFATIFYRGNTITPGDSALHNNTFVDNYDVKYFDPTITLTELKVNLYDNAGVDTGNNIVIVFELLIETKDKVRVYR